MIAWKGLNFHLNRDFMKPFLRYPHVVDSFGRLQGCVRSHFRHFVWKKNLVNFGPNPEQGSNPLE